MVTETSWGNLVGFEMLDDSLHHYERPPSSDWKIIGGCSWIRANWDNPKLSQFTQAKTIHAAGGITIETPPGEMKILTETGSLENPIKGTEGNDIIDGTDGHDYIDGLGGTDIICGGPGNDVIHAGGGEWEVIFGGGLGVSKVNCDSLGTGALHANGLLWDVVFGEKGNDTICGGPGHDLLIGGRESDYPFNEADGDKDHVLGGAGSDWILGGPGADTIEGGAGSDFLFGGKGGANVGDNLYGETQKGYTQEQCPLDEPCNDRISGEYGNDQIYGGPGDDNLDGDINPIYLLQLGVKGKPMPQWGCTGTGDQNTYLTFCIGNDYILGNFGDDTIQDVGSSVANEGKGGQWEPGNEIYGQEGNDRIQGGKYTDDIYGGAGDDSIWGGSGSDQLYGGGGISSEGKAVELGAGDDKLYGQFGADYLTAAEIKLGGEGDDTCYTDIAAQMESDNGACDDGN